MTGSRIQNMHGHMIEKKKQNINIEVLVFMYQQYDIVDKDDRVVG
jgi:hypothetical protein